MKNEYITKENALNLYKMFGNNSERLSVSMFKVLLDNLPSEDGDVVEIDAGNLNIQLNNWGTAKSKIKQIIPINEVLIATFVIYWAVFFPGLILCI